MTTKRTRVYRARTCHACFAFVLRIIQKTAKKKGGIMLIDRILNTYPKGSPIGFIWPDEIEGQQAMKRIFESLEHAECFDLDDVSMAYTSHREAKNFVFARDCGSVMPPFRETWFEAIHDNRKVGCLVMLSDAAHMEINTEVLIKPADKVQARSSLERPFVADGKSVSLNATRITLSPVIEVKGNPLIFPYLVSCAIAATGEPMSLPWFSPKYSDSRIDSDVREMARLTGMMSSFFWFALALLNCKNITKQEIKTSPALQKARLRKGKALLRNFYVLNVTTEHRVKAEGGTDNATQVTSKRLHMVRGHLADYTQGAGLFGKLKGRYWIPAHARGDIAQGEIQKRYAVKAS